MTRLALLRHGHTAWNRAGRIQGRTDVPLDEDAIASLSQLRLPAPWDNALVWSSPLSRAAQTARLVSGLEPRQVTALMEMNWGDWEGQKGAVLRMDPSSGFRDIEEWGWGYTPPGGESWNVSAARVASVVRRVSAAHAGAHIIAVAHFGVILTQVQAVLGVTAKEVLAHKIDNLSVTTLHPDTGRATHINHTP